MGLEILAACGKTAWPDMGRNMTSEDGLTIEGNSRLSGNRTRGGHFIHHLEGRGPSGGRPEGAYPAGGSERKVSNG